MSNLFRGEITNGVAEFNFGEELKGEWPTTVFLNGVVDQTFFGEEYPDGGVLNPIDHGNVGDKVTFVIGNKVKTLNKINSGGGLFDSDITIPAGIPDSVTTIGNSAFQNCPFFTGSLIIPDSVTTLESVCFNSCTGFTGSLTIPDSVTSIANGAFGGCSGLGPSLTIGRNVASIGTSAFQSCSNISNVNCYIEKSILDQGAILLNTAVTTIHARSTDSSWTAGAGQTIASKSNIEVIKDLPG